MALLHLFGTSELILLLPSPLVLQLVHYDFACGLYNPVVLGVMTAAVIKY